MNTVIKASTLILALFCMFLVTPALAQDSGKIEGAVVDENTNEPLIGANVVLFGTELGGATNEEGRYSILDIPQGDYQVQISFIGYETQMQSVSVKTWETIQLNFALKSRPLRMDEVMITAMRGRAERPISISVVAEEEIEASRHAGAYDVFKKTPGMHVIKGHAIGYGLASKTAGRVLIRGLGRRAGGNLRIRGIQVLVDGIPDFSQSHGHPFPDVHALDNIERIEIIKGPASVRYGNAMSGAIVMTTKTPKSGLNYYLKGSRGSWSTTENVGRLGYGGERGYTQFSGNYRHTDGHRDDAPDELTAYNGSMKLGYKVSPNFKLNMNGLAGHFEWDNPGPGGLPGGKTDWVMADLNSIYTFGKHEASVKLWGVDGEAKFSNGLNEPITQLGIKSEADLKYSTEGTVKLGFDWMNYDIARNDVSQGNFNEVALYSVLEHKFSPKVSVEGGLRFTHNEQFGEDISPEIGVLYKPVGRTTFRGRIAHGFRTPNAFETTFGGDANPDLVAADLWQFEIGLNQSFGNRVTLDVAEFLQEGDNMIRSESDPNSPTGSRLANTGQFSHKGMEAAVTIRATQNLAVTATTTNLDLGDDTALAPHNIFTFGLAFTPQRFTFELDGRQVTELYNKDNKEDKLDDFLVVDFQGSYRVSRYFSLFLAMENLLDADYELVKGFSMPQRSVFLGINLNNR